MKEPWHFLALFVVTIGGIDAGVFSPTEAASVGAFGAILLGVSPASSPTAALLGAIEITVTDQRPAVRDRVRRQPVLLLHGADPFARPVRRGTLAADLSGLAIMVLIVVAYIGFGRFLEAIGMLLITVPDSCRW